MRITQTVFHLIKDMAYVYSEKQARYLHFKESLTEFIGAGSENRSLISVVQKGEKIIIDTENTHGRVEIGRAPYCPFSSKNMLEYDWNDRPERIPVAGSCIIETPVNGQGIFLTRRAGHLRTFPRLWVPPGGHIDQNETMETAIKREVDEETGLSSDDSPNSLLEPNFSKLCAWESAYPGVAIPNSAPKRHHLVVYFLAKFKRNIPDFDYSRPPLLKVNLEENEVSSCVWLSRSHVEALVKDANDAEGLFDVCNPNDFTLIGKIIREAFKERPSMSVPEYFLKNTSWHECIDFPSAELVNRLGPCWYWHVSTKKWILRPFNELFQGMISGFRTPSLSPERPANSNFIPSPPSRCSIGCVFAMESWLKLTKKH